MKALYALCPDTQAAQSAVDALRRASSEEGFDAGQIVVLSGDPASIHGLGGKLPKTPQYLLAALGALAGGGLGFGLIYNAQVSYPILTGAMPLMPSWSSGIIIYECGMLGAFFTTILAMLIALRLPKRGAPLSDPEVYKGKILVGVTDPPASAQSALRSLLREAGGGEVKEFPANQA